MTTQTTSQDASRPTPTRSRASRLGMSVVGRLAPRRTVSALAVRFRTPQRHPLKAWEEEVEASAVRGTSASGISHLRWTPDRVTSRVLAMHGWEGRATQWGPLARELLVHGIETVAVDAPAHGRSPGDEADPLVFAQALRDVAAEFGPFDAVIGHSMGGGALTLALHDGMSAAKAVLIATPASFADVAMRFATHAGLPARLRTAFLDEVGTSCGMSVEEADITRLASDIAIPALVIHDDDDDETPFGDAERISLAWDRSSILRTHGLGHRRLLRDPLVIDEVIDFLVDWSVER